MARKFQISTLAVIIIVLVIIQAPAFAALQPFSHELSAIQHALLEAEEAILTAEIFGRAPSFVGAEYMRVFENYVHAKILDAIYGWEFDLLIHYEVVDACPLRNIIWTLVATNAPHMRLRYFRPITPSPLTAAEYATVRFYYHCIETDPMVMLLPEAYRYNAVEIPGQYLWEYFRKQMLYHTGINIWDLWFEDDKLYVDLHSTEEILFNWGTTGSLDRGTRLEKTIASLPGVVSFEILVGGRRGVETSHYSFNWIATVENGEIVHHNR